MKEYAIRLVILHLPHCTSLTKAMTLDNARRAAKATANECLRMRHWLPYEVINILEGAIKEIETVTIDDIQKADKISFNLM